MACRNHLSRYEPEVPRAVLPGTSMVRSACAWMPVDACALHARRIEGWPVSSSAGLSARVSTPPVSPRKAGAGESWQRLVEDLRFFDLRELWLMSA